MPFAPLTTDDEILWRIRDCVETETEGNAKIREEKRSNLHMAWGDQWSAEAKAARDGTRPMYTFDVLDRIVDGIAGNARQNPIAISLSPVDGKSDKFSAWLKEGILRSIQYRSESQRAFAWALECAARLNEGFFRARVDYENDRSLNACLSVERCPDAFMVGMDPRANCPHGGDADWAFERQKYNREEFKAAFGEDASDDQVDPRALANWYDATGRDASTVKKYLVVEFFWKEAVQKWIGEDTAGNVVDLDGEPQADEQGAFALVQGQPMPIDPRRARKVDTYRIRGVFACGHRILEHLPDWEGRHLPWFRVSGKEVIGDGERRVKSAVTGARDVQKSLNMVITGMIEAVAGNVAGKWVATWKSIKAHWDKFWSKSNDPSNKLLVYDVDANAPNGGRPEWVSPPVQIIGQFTLVEQMLQLVRHTTGRGEEMNGLRSNATSGVQERMRVQQSAETSAIFPDNLAAAVEAWGRDTCHMLPIYYRGSRTLSAVLEEDSATPETVTIPFGRPMDEGTAKQLKTLAAAKKIPVPELLQVLELNDSDEDVRVKVSRSWATRRLEGLEYMQGALQYVPQEFVGDVLPLLLSSWDAPGVDKVAERIAKKIEERDAQAAMKTAADAAVEALTQNPYIAQALKSLTQQAVKTFMSQQGGPQGLPPGMEGGPDSIGPDAMAPEGFDDSMMGPADDEMLPGFMGNEPPQGGFPGMGGPM